MRGVKGLSIARNQLPSQGELTMIFKRSLVILLCGSIAIATAPVGFADQTDQPAASSPTPVGQQPPEQLQDLVAPIALYPDALVAQILAAATYPPEVVEADRWMQQHSKLTGQKLGNEVDKQSWDPSVKALTQFPSVLANMDKNLSWTSSLGDAYVNQPQDVMDAVQVMRRRAQSAGELKSSPQETVTEGQTIVIQPANPEVVYVPQYDPWLVYGAPLVAWPGWYPFPGLYLTTPGFAFGFGIGVGFFGGFGWGWHNWGFDWAHRAVLFNHGAYISHSRTFLNHNAFINHHNVMNHNTIVNHNTLVNHNTVVNHNTMSNHNTFGHDTRSGAFSGFNHGGTAGGFSSRGRSSFGGGFHGGGGSHGGGGRR
jgi:uncharacterized membrane protein YgcG